jgi:hypothetical protein
MGPPTSRVSGASGGGRFATPARNDRIEAFREPPGEPAPVGERRGADSAGGGDGGAEVRDTPTSLGRDRVALDPAGLQDWVLPPPPPPPRVGRRRVGGLRGVSSARDGCAPSTTTRETAVVTRVDRRLRKVCSSSARDTMSRQKKACTHRGGAARWWSACASGREKIGLIGGTHAGERVKLLNKQRVSEHTDEPAWR